jgi:hypothetical protein
MTTDQPKLSFWVLTAASAKEAVQVYFEPLHRITEWLFDRPARR